ncbi:MAG: hypothetical protein Roseis2KO_43810 [Roseivirga sp.]
MEQNETQIQVENAGAIIENSSIQGEQVAGRDIYNYSPGGPSFINVQLDFFGSKQYLAPKISSDSLNQLMSQRILLIYGGQSFDKGGFIRHLAFKAQSETEFETQELEINEENESLYHQISKNPSKSIYLLDRLHPQHVDYDLQRLQALAVLKSVYVIISTDLSLDVWQLNSSEKENYTFQIPKQNLYHKADLTDYLRAALLERLSDRDLEILVEIREKDSVLGKSIGTIATKLGSPENLSLFVLRLKNQTKPSEETVLNIIDSLLSSDEGIVRKWFLSLSNKQKLIALGAALLEGAYDDQFFSIIGQVIDQMWKHSDGSLQALDYCDLDFLSDFFRFENLGDGRQVLQAKFPNQKIEIINSSWHLYRRHLLSIVPIFFETAINSLNTNSADWENFGTRQKRANLRMVIGQTISEIGLVSTFSIENTLIAFAAHPDDRVKRIASKSLARWREFEEDERLFDLLQSWLEDERPQKIISEYLTKRENWQKDMAYQERALSYLRASAIHALSYSANYDSPNQLHKRIIEILLSLVTESRNPLIIQALKTAVPKLVHHHILQLKDVLLEKFMKYDDMIEPVAHGLLRAYKNYPKDLKVTLDRWFEECQENGSQLNRRKKFTHRDKVLVTILEFYGNLDFEGPNQVINLDEVYQKLTLLSKSEERRNVRDAIFKTMAKLMPWNWKLWENELPLIWEHHDFRDAKHLVDGLVLVFLHARKSLKGSTYYFHWKEEPYPIWLDMYDRPKTALEIKMGHWIRSDHESLKKLAILTFLDIAKTFELDELEGIIETKKELWQKQHTTNYTVPVRQQTTDQQTRDYGLSLFTQIKIFVLLLFQPKANKSTLKTALVTLYKYKRFNREYKKHLVLVFRKWAATESSLLQKLARWLKRLI